MTCHETDFTKLHEEGEYLIKTGPNQGESQGTTHLKVIKVCIIDNVLYWGYCCDGGEMWRVSSDYEPHQFIEIVGKVNYYA